MAWWVQSLTVTRPIYMTARDVRVIKAVLFDMDDTLLSVNLTAFMARYVSRSEERRVGREC